MKKPIRIYMHETYWCLAVCQDLDVEGRVREWHYRTWREAIAAMAYIWRVRG